MLTERISEAALDQGVAWFQGEIIVLGSNTSSEELWEIINAINEINSLRGVELEVKPLPQKSSENIKAQ